MGLDVYFEKKPKDVKPVGYLKNAYNLVNYLELDNCEMRLIPKYELDAIQNYVDEKLKNKNKGAYLYDEEYYEELKEIKVTLENIIKNTDFNKDEIYITAWW